ncbi:unnamed protein product [Paramecium sonneborni]|uniref:Uncharacterized protein n=1 Tax=Paramecium sonneborni TaxID=65129 RepID=A0A8S1RRB0_9CILI|nr:unnamed protein product [Paramecium sonneborni]
MMVEVKLRLLKFLRQNHQKVQVIRQIHSEIKKFLDYLLEEKKLREKTLGKIWQIYIKIFHLIEGRETITEAFQKLLDDACVKLNKKFDIDIILSISQDTILHLNNYIDQKDDVIQN